MEVVMPRTRMASLPKALPLGPDAFDEIYGRYKEPVYRLACALSDNIRDSEDLFQETWLRVARSGRDEARAGDTKSWLFTITANLHRDALRRKKIRRLFFLERAKAMTDEAADADAGWDAAGFSSRDIAAQSDLRLCLGRAVAALPALQREVFVLKDVEGYKHSEIGRMLGIPEPTVRTLLHRAVKSLQKALASFDPGLRRTEGAKESEP